MTQGKTMNLTQAAKYIGLSTAALREYMEQGKLRHLRHHTRKVLIKAEWLDEFVEKLADETMDKVRMEENR